MNPGLLVKLRPSGPWRIGPDSGARNRVDVIYHSDSLYSAVTSAMARMGWLEEWLDATARSASPAVWFSSCFPFVDDLMFIVPPRTVWPPVSTSAKAGAVRWKSVKFVPLSVVQSILAGERLQEGQWNVDGPSDCLAPAGSHGPFRTAVRWSAGVDRLTGASERHSVGCIEFRPGAGLWAVVSFLDEAARERWSDPVKAVFRLLADTGFGGERSRGWGRSDAPEFIDGMLPDLILPPPVESAAAAVEPVETAGAAAIAASPVEPLTVEPETAPEPEPEPENAAEPVAETPESEPSVSEPPAVEPEPETASAAVKAVTPIEPLTVEPETAPEPEPENAAEAVAETPEPEPSVSEPPAVEPEPETASAAVKAVTPIEPLTVEPEAAPEPEPENTVETAAAAGPVEPLTVEPETAPAPEPESVIVAVAETPESDPPVEEPPGPAPEPEIETPPAVEEPPVDPEPAPEELPPAGEPEPPQSDPPVEEPPQEAAPEPTREAVPEAALEPELPSDSAPVAELPPASAPAHPHWLLSLFTPAAADDVDWRRGNYEVLARGGRVDSPAGSGELKKQIQMVVEGSVLYAESAPRGSAADVAPDGFAHPVFRAGFALAIPLPEVR